MANTRKDVELRINANDFGDKSLDKLLDIFEKLRRSQEEFAKGGDASQRNLRELKQDLADLQAIAVELKNRAGLVDQFTLTQEQAAKAAQRLEQAKQALAAFNAKQQDGVALSKAQQSELRKLTRDVAQAEKGFVAAGSKVEALGKELATLGTGDTSATREALLRFSTDLGTALSSADTAIRKYDETLRKNAKTEQDAVKEKKRLEQAARELGKSLTASFAKVEFNNAGRDALKAASSVAELSKDYDALAVSTKKAGEGIRAILDPSRQALTTIDGLEGQVKSLNATLAQAQTNTKLREEVRQLRSEYAGLATEAGKVAASLADDIGRFRQTQQAVNTLRGEVREAADQVRVLGVQMGTAAAPSAELAKQMERAKATLATTVAQFDKQAAALATMRKQLREAGVDVKNLAAVEQRLEQVARGVVTAQTALGVAAVRVGEGADKAGKGFSLFEDKGRKALSTAQRLRGELLSLASSYLGVFAAINAGKATIDAAVSRETILRRLELTEGSASAAVEKFKELRRQADAIGVDFESSAKGFSDIAVGAREAGVSTERLDNFYANLSKTTRGLSLDGEKTSRVFTAVSQVFGKNKLQSEELVQQLGEHLPGVVTIAQKALGLNAEELSKALEESRLGVDALIVIVDEYAKRVSGLSKNDKSVIDGLVRFKNAMFDLKLAVADSDFLDTFTQLLKDAAQAVRSGELNGAVKGFATVLRLAGEAARFLLENITAVEVAVSAFIALNVGKLLFGLLTFFRDSAVAAKVFGVAVRGLGAAFAFLAANPIVAVIAVLATLLVSTEKGRAALRALWQIVVEFGGALKDLLSLDFTGFANRIKGSMGRVANAFNDAKEAADGLANVAPGGAPSNLRRNTGGASGNFDEQTGGATGSWEDDVVEAENRRRVEAVLTKKTVDGIEKSMTDVRKAAAKEQAKAIGDVESEVRAEYQDTQDKIDELFKRAKATGNKDTQDAAKGLQARFDAEIAAIVKARKAIAGAKFGRDERAEQQEALERVRQEAEITKDGLHLQSQALEQSFREGLVELQDYYDRRARIASIGLDTEIQMARDQIAVLEKDKGRDPTVAKRIVALQTTINQKEQEKVLAERQFKFEADEGARALRRQVSEIDTALGELLGGHEQEQGQLRAIQQYYEDQLRIIGQLPPAERERKKRLLDQIVAIRTQLSVIDELAKKTNQLDALRNAAITAAANDGRLNRVQQLRAQSEANKLLLADQERQAEMYRAVGLSGSDAYRAIQLELIRLRGETDLLGREVRGIFKDAVQAGIESIFTKDTSQTDRIDAARQALIEFNRQQELGVVLTEKQKIEYAKLQDELNKANAARDSMAERALKAFGKSIAKSLAQSFADELTTTLAKALQESFIGQFFKSLLSGQLFSGLGSLFGTGHTGGLVGQTGATKRVSPFAFIGAPRYHSGGLPGLRNDEVAMIAKRGEEVLSPTDPRNVLNQRKQAQSPGGGAAGLGKLQIEVHPDALRMTVQDWLDGEIGRQMARQTR